MTKLDIKDLHDPGDGSLWWEIDGQRYHTNCEREGLWLDGMQICGTGQFSLKVKNPERKIRRQFHALLNGGLDAETER